MFPQVLQLHLNPNVSTVDESMRSALKQVAERVKHQLQEGQRPFRNADVFVQLVGVGSGTNNATIWELAAPGLLLRC